MQTHSYSIRAQGTAYTLLSVIRFPLEMTWSCQCGMREMTCHRCDSRLIRYGHQGEAILQEQSLDSSILLARFLLSGSIVSTDQTRQIFSPRREMCISCHCEYRTINLSLVSEWVSVNGLNLLLWVSQNSNNYHTSLYYAVALIVLGNLAASLGLNRKGSTNSLSEACMRVERKKTQKAQHQIEEKWKVTQMASLIIKHGKRQEALFRQVKNLVLISEILSQN